MEDEQKPIKQWRARVYITVKARSQMEAAAKIKRMTITSMHPIDMPIIEEFEEVEET